MKVQLLDADEKNVRVLRKSDRKSFVIPLSTLKASDQVYLREWRKSQKPEDTSKKSEKLLEKIAPGNAVDYATLAFEPTRWKQLNVNTTMEPWVGHEVTFLAWPNNFDPEVMVNWVNALDRGWRLYRETTNKSPILYKELRGKPVIAAVPSDELTCGLGCGMVGATGIELAGFYESDYEAVKGNPLVIPHIVFYEMGRNYYTFEDRHSLFVTGFAVFMRYVCMDTLGYTDVEDEGRKRIEAAERYYQASSLTFLEIFTDNGEKKIDGDRIKDASGAMLPSDTNCTYASAMLRLHRECGGNDWLKSFYRELDQMPDIKVDSAETALLQCWNWFLSASVAAGRDLSPIFVDQWKFPISPAARKVLGEVKWTAKTLSASSLARKIRKPFG